MKILLVADSPLILAGLRSVIVDTIHTTHFTETPLLADTLSLCRQANFQLAIIDIGKLVKSDIETIASLRHAAPEMNIWINLRSDFIMLRTLLRAGIHGLFSSKTSSPEFARALVKINEGGKFISEEIQDSLVSAVLGTPAWASLTAKQEKIASLLAAGLDRRSIAEQIRVKPATITHYRQIIFKKLGIESLYELRQIKQSQ